MADEPTRTRDDESADDNPPEGAVCYWRHVAACPGAHKLGGGNWRLRRHQLTLPDSQPKTQKSLKEVGVYTGVLHLAPGDASGYEMCPWRTPGCTKACLGVSTARVRLFPGIQEARIRRTHEFMEERPEFMEDLARDIAAVRRKAQREGLRPAIRLNGTSDQPWEAFPVTVDGVEYRNLMEAYPDVQFYDYSKGVTRVLRSLHTAPGGDKWPANYHLTYSYNESPHAAIDASRVLAAGGNVSAVFRHKPLPQRFTILGTSYPVVDATKHDVRYLDPAGSIAGLSALGTAVNDTSGFVLDALIDDADSEVVDKGGRERRRGGYSFLRDRNRGRAERHLMTGG